MRDHQQDGNKIFLGTGHGGRHVNYLPTAQIPSVSKASKVTRVSQIGVLAGQDRNLGREDNRTHEIRVHVSNCEEGGLVNGKMTDRPRRRRKSCVREIASERMQRALRSRSRLVSLNLETEPGKLGSRPLARSPAYITADSDSEQTTCDKWRPNQDLQAAKAKQVGREAGAGAGGRVAIKSFI